MTWFRNIIKKILVKKASKIDIKNRALQQLEQGANSNQVAVQLIMQMNTEDPEFARGPIVRQIMDARMDSNSLINVINSIDVGSNAGLPVIDVPAEKSLPVEETEEQDTNFLGEGEEASPSDTEPTIDENTITQEGIEGEELIITKQLESAPDFNERISADPTLLQTFEIPVSAMSQMTKKLAIINKKLKNMYHPEIKIEFSGNSYNKPIQFQNRKVQEPYIQVKITGTLPSPTEEISVRIHEPLTDRHGNPVYESDGKTPKMKKIGDEPKGVKLLAKVHHHPLSEEEQNKYLQTERPGSPLRQVIENSRQQGVTPYFNQVEHLEKAYPIDGKFWYSRPQECFSCKARHARVATYVGAIVPPEKMIDRTAITTGEDGAERKIVLTRKVNTNKNKNGDPIWVDMPYKTIKDEDIEVSPQEQFGGSCIDPFDAVKTINDLKNWVKRYKNADKNNQEKKKAKRYKGGTRGNVPTDKLFGIAVAMLRNPRYMNDPGYVGTGLGRESINYLYDMQRREQAKTLGRRYVSYRNPLKIKNEDQEIGNSVASWWREKLGSLDPEDDQNNVTLSILPTISVANKPGRENCKRIAEMVKAYLDANNITLEPLPDEPEEIEQIEEPAIPTPVETPVETILDEPEVPEEEPVAPGVLDDITNVEEGSAFVSQLLYINSKPFRRGARTNYVNNFKGDDGQKYVAFTNDEPFDAIANTRVYVRGVKGITNRRYQTITLNKLIKISPDKIQEYINTPETSAIEPEAPVIEPEAEPVVEPTTEIEAPVIKPETPETKAKEDILKRIGQINTHAENVITTGLDKNGNPMSPETLIPLYVDRIGKLWHKLDTEEWKGILNNTLSEYGKDTLIGRFKMLKSYVERYF